MKFTLKCLGLFFALILIISCKSAAPIENKTDEKNFKFKFDSSVVKVIKTQDIHDSLFVHIAAVKTTKPECDSVCQAKIDEILASISSKKSNGKNTSGFYYDKYKKMLVAYNNLKGSNDSIIKTNHGKNEYYAITKTKTIPVNILTREQKFNVWTGRLFWVGFLAFSVFKIRNKILGLA